MIEILIFECEMINEAFLYCFLFFFFFFKCSLTLHVNVKAIAWRSFKSDVIEITDHYKQCSTDKIR